MAKKPTGPNANNDTAAKSANIVLTSLRASGKLDKHGARLERALQAIVDGGDSATLPDLATQVDTYMAKGTPDAVKSTSRRKAPEAKPDLLTAEDKAQVTAEAAARSGRITAVQNDVSGTFVVVSSGRENFTLKRGLEDKEFSEAAVVGKTYLIAKRMADDLRKKAPAGHLAKGLDARNAPQSVAAHQAKKQAEKAPAKPAAAKADPKKEARKAERAEKAAPKADDKRGITILKKDFAFGREGSARRASWDKVLKAKTVAAFIAAGGAAKYLPRWASAGAIKLG